MDAYLSQLRLCDVVDLLGTVMKTDRLRRRRHLTTCASCSVVQKSSLSTADELGISSSTNDHSIQSIQRSLSLPTVVSMSSSAAILSTCKTVQWDSQLNARLVLGRT